MRNMSSISPKSCLLALKDCEKKAVSVRCGVNTSVITVMDRFPCRYITEGWFDSSGWTCQPSSSADL